MNLKPPNAEAAMSNELPRKRWADAVDEGSAYLVGFGNWRSERTNRNGCSEEILKGKATFSLY